MQSLLDALSNPSMRHAMIVHAPIGLAFASLVVAFLAALLTRIRGLRYATLALFVALAIGAWQAEESGEAARGALTGTLGEDAYALLQEHEQLGERLPLLALAGAGFALLALARVPRLAGPASWVTVFVSLVVCGWVVWTAHHGGRLVYEFGVGTPGGLQDDASPPARDPRVAYFEAEVEPILAARCQSCHNPARAGRSGSLDQTDIEALLRGGVSGPALVPGDPEASLLIQRIRSDDPEWIMPPPDEGKPLTESEIAKIERWIREGAVWP